MNVLDLSLCQVINLILVSLRGRMMSSIKKHRDGMFVKVLKRTLYPKAL